MTEPVTPTPDEGCGPYTCDFPLPPTQFPWRARWTCPKCGTTYVRRMASPRWWSFTKALIATLFRSGWSDAPDGYWSLPLVKS